MSRKTFFRIVLDIIIAICIIQGWWFIALPLALICTWKYFFFIEIIIGGIMYDSLFGFSSGNGVWGYLGTILSVVAFVAIIFLKKMLRR